MLFEKTWDDPYQNAIWYADQLPNGDYILIGAKSLSLYPLGPAPAQLYACRMDRRGTIIWAKDWGNIYEIDAIGKTIKCRNGTYMVTGGGLSGLSGGIGDITVTNIDADGNILFFKYYNFYYDDHSGDIFETDDSCFVLSGGVAVLPGDYFPAFLKIDQQGNEIWRRSQSSLGGHYPGYIAETSDRGFICAGVAGTHTYYAKYKDDGSMDWIRYLPDTTYNWPEVLRVNSDGSFNIYISILPYPVTGSLRSFDSLGNSTHIKNYSKPLGNFSIDKKDSSFCAFYGSSDFYKMNRDSVFVKVVGLKGSDTLTKLIRGYIYTNDAGYLGFGAYSTPTTYPSFYIVKFGSDGRYQPEEFSETVNVFPNPSIDGNVTLTFDILADENVQVRILSSDGKLVYTNELFCPANSHTELPIHLFEKSVNAGMYIIEARTADAIIRKKLIVTLR